MSAAVIKPRVLAVRGDDIGKWLDEVARLRIGVFRGFPYLYDGDVDYEASYLARYARSPGGVLVLALDGERVVGASTGLPLAEDDSEFHVPFQSRGMDIGTVFYCAESVLLPEYRGLGIGHRFFDERESHARALGGFRHIAFAAVERPENHPARPADYRSNEVFWRKRGYEPQPDMRMSLAWKDLGDRAQSHKPLIVWLRELEEVQ